MMTETRAEQMRLRVCTALNPGYSVHRSGGEPLPQMPLLHSGGRPNGSIRRASASTASAMSSDTVSHFRA